MPDIVVVITSLIKTSDMAIPKLDNYTFTSAVKELYSKNKHFPVPVDKTHATESRVAHKFG